MHWPPGEGGADGLGAAADPRHRAAAPVLDQLQEKDPARIFAQPVSLKEVGVRLLCRSLGSAVAQGMWRTPPSVCVSGQRLGCPAVLREHGVCLRVYVCT